MVDQGILLSKLTNYGIARTTLLLSDYPGERLALELSTAIFHRLVPRYSHSYPLFQ